MNRNANNRIITSTIAFLAVFVAALFLGSCGGGDYEKPSTTLSGSPLISASTLKSWIDDGKVNSTGYDRVVILDVTTYATYTAGHVPGALFVDSSEIGQNRNEGVAGSTNEVLEGSKMDDLIQRCGIDGNTTVVFTSSSMVSATRAYFTFRYWGFPQGKLKLLDGLNTAWKSTYGLVAGLPTVVARSTYSAKSNRVLRSDLRVSLSEMIDYADGKIPDVLPIDVRGTATTGSYGGIQGSTTGLFAVGTPAVTDYTVFEGRIRGAQALPASDLYSSTTNSFNPVDQLVASFTSIGLDSTKTAYVYCKVGFQSSVTFFVIDGILGWPVALYDGSWAQWGQLSGNSNVKGQLKADSPWRTDIAGRTDNLVYNYPVISTLTFTTASGTSDLVVGSIYSGATTSTFNVEIDGVAPDTFRWSVDNGTTWTPLVAITGSAQTLVSGLTVSFGSKTGHALNDSWSFIAKARKNIEQFTADGSVCSASYQASGTTTNLYGGTVACTNLPASYDSNANRIEEADKAYMGSGGAGTSGGGTSVPSGC
jgi:3-mercaptopyruvate sulfurtransferase SseA